MVAGLFICARTDPTKPNPPLVRQSRPSSLAVVLVVARAVLTEAASSGGALQGACLAKESLVVGGADFTAAELGDTLVYRPKTSVCQSIDRDCHDHGHAYRHPYLQYLREGC